MLDVDVVIINVGGCGVFFIEYDYLLKDDFEWLEWVVVFV